MCIPCNLYSNIFQMVPGCWSRPPGGRSLRKTVHKLEKKLAVAAGEEVPLLASIFLIGHLSLLHGTHYIMAFSPLQPCRSLH